MIYALVVKYLVTVYRRMGVGLVGGDDSGRILGSTAGKRVASSVEMRLDLVGLLDMVVVEGCLLLVPRWLERLHFHPVTKNDRGNE